MEFLRLIAWGQLPGLAVRYLAQHGLEKNPAELEIGEACGPPFIGHPKAMDLLV
jgi:hypothetical protein